MNKAIFLDRDGIINQAIIKNNKPYSPVNLKEFIINKFINKYLIFFKKKNFLLNKYRLSGLLNAYIKKPSWLRPDDIKDFTN